MNSAHDQAQMIHLKTKLAEEKQKRLESEKKIQQLLYERQSREFPIPNSTMNQFQSESANQNGLPPGSFIQKLRKF